MRRLFLPLVLSVLFGTTGCENMPDRLGEGFHGLSRCAGGTNGDLDYCDATCVCGHGEGYCNTDAECSAGLECGPQNGLKFGFPWNWRVCWPPHCESGTMDADETAVDCGGSCGVCYCPYPDGHYAHCNSVQCPCESGEGDCDSDAECRPGLICTVATGPRFGWTTATDLCLPSHCVDGTLNGDETARDCGGSCGACVCPGAPGDAEFCTLSCPCAAGQGDCDEPNDCEAGLSCVSGQGPSYGFAAGTDVCIASHCTNGIQDGDEGGIDCGGSCGRACPAAELEIQSVDSSGAEGNGAALHFLGLSSGGRFVAFISSASNLVAGDTNDVADAFVRDNSLGTTRRVSVAVNGAQANGRSTFASISDDGRYVAFVSSASNLVPGDTNGVDDVFVKDRTGGSIWRLSRSSAGAEANGPSLFARISGSGNIVVYTSSATNLVDGDANAVDDIFVTERVTGATIRASQSGGVEANGASTRGWLDRTGTFIVYSSSASNLVTGDTNGAPDIFLHHRLFRTTTRVSVATDGTQANSASIHPRISADGNTVVFTSFARNLVVADTNNRYDVFARDRTALTTELVSVSSSGPGADQDTVYGHPSADGRYVVMSSAATNLVPGDTNGTGDIFVRDRTAGATIRIESALGAPNGPSNYALIDPTGAFVAFVSDATNLVASDTNGLRDVFLAPNP